MTSHALFIQELFEEGESWRMTVAELNNAQVLSMEMFPHGVPYGVTVNEDIVITEPDLVGSFLLGGLTSDTVSSMAEDYAEAFRHAGLVPHLNTMSTERTPQDGYVRTWLVGVDDPWDIPEEEALELHADNWVDATMATSLTVWDMVDDQTITFHYENAAEYPVMLNTIEQSQMPATKLLNHANFLIIPSDESLNPILSARTCPRMFELRLALNEADRKVKEQQLEIGEMVLTFQKAIGRLAKAGRWRNPVDVFQGGLGKR